MTENASTDRVVIRYVEGPEIQLAPQANATPGTLREGDVTEVDRWAGDSLVATVGSVWEYATRADLDAQLEQAERAQTVEHVEPEQLKGAALTAALKAAELSTSGTVAEKRQRLADHRAALDEQARLEAEQATTDPAPIDGDDANTEEGDPR